MPPATRMVFGIVGTMLPKGAVGDISVWGVGRVTTAAVGDPVNLVVESQEYLTRRLLTCCLGTSTRTVGGGGMPEHKARALLAVDLLQSVGQHTISIFFVQAGLF
jgi:hypothetical protein